MKKIHLLALGAGALLATAAAAQMAASPTPDETKQALIRLECEWGRAYVTADVAALRRFEHDDYVFVDEDGAVMGKTEEIDAVASGKVHFTTMQDGGMQVRLHGNTAVITGRSTVAGSYEGESFSGNYAWIDTWVKQPDGRWQIVAEGLAKLQQQDAAAPQPTASSCATMQ